MGNTWGNNIKLSIFGESHGDAIGIIIDGLPSGIQLDLDEIKKEMDRRKPGKSNISTSRKEADEVKILSGFFEGKTTGTPLCGIIENTNTISKDYNKNIMRPGHADYAGFVKYNGFNDYRGGGHFSGRITAPLVFAGAVAKQILSKSGIAIGAHIKQVGDISDCEFDRVNINESLINQFKYKEFPTIDIEIGNKMKELIGNVKENLDSIGGQIECAIVGLNPGLGEPFFDSVESTISSIMFSIPAVKGIEFGAGFKFTNMLGSQANDSIYIKNEKVLTYTNNNAGITGGITNGMPIIFSLAIKPTPSIARPQNTIDVSKNENIQTEITGRHDPCIVHRAVPVVESCAAIAILDLMSLEKFL